MNSKIPELELLFMIWISQDEVSVPKEKDEAMSSDSEGETSAQVEKQPRKKMKKGKRKMSQSSSADSDSGTGKVSELEEGYSTIGRKKSGNSQKISSVHGKNRFID